MKTSNGRCKKGRKLSCIVKELVEKCLALMELAEIALVFTASMKNDTISTC